jgi:hypothetical protein
MDLFAEIQADPAPKPAPRPDDMTTSLLVITLRAAVPMWIAEVNKRHGETRAELLADWRKEAGPVVAANGDHILYLGHKRGDSAKAFNSLARGLAVLAHAAGGVTVFGLVWCAKHSPGGAYADGPPCPACLAEEDVKRTALRQRMASLLAALAARQQEAVSNP